VHDYFTLTNIFHIPTKIEDTAEAGTELYNVTDRVDSFTVPDYTKQLENHTLNDDDVDEWFRSCLRT
jgi:hypothetical protein